MARTPIFQSAGQLIFDRCGGPLMTAHEARSRIVRETEYAIANPALERICILLVADLIAAIREAEGQGAANDGDFDPTNPPARAAIPHALEIAA